MIPKENDMNATGIRIFFGLPHNEGRPLLNQIARKRFEQIKPTLKRRDGDYLYEGRTHPANVADRFSGSIFRKFGWKSPWTGIVGKLRYAWACFSTKFGLQDEKIESTWHERAACEWWYTYEKEWD
jgi:hypothetical protein